jgi:NAD(P)-dependent dehydrogenase (short-subunit alcohol dehydrogenase family)
MRANAQGLDICSELDRKVLDTSTLREEEVARWIALLLSPVSSFMTGAVIPLDGGQVIPHA